jgi:hypothetical protein
VYLALWEPRIPAEAWGLFPVEWRGRGGWDRPPWNITSWCMSHPDAAVAFSAMAGEAFASVPQIDGLKMGTHDNDAWYCNDDCPRCKGRPRAPRVADVFRRLFEAAAPVGGNWDYVLYTWWWSDEEVAAVAPVVGNRRVTVLGRTSQGLPQFWKGRELGRVFDLALGLPGVGKGFQQTARRAQQHGWDFADMPAWGHAIEYFWLPYTPAPNRVAETLGNLQRVGASGWFDYDCGGVYPGINTEIVRQYVLDGQSENVVAATLRQLYVPAEIPAAARAYELAEEALALRPIAFDPPEVRNLSGRSTIEFVVCLPFDPDDIRGFDQGHRQFFSHPANFITPGSMPTLLEMHAACADKWREAWSVFQLLHCRAAWADWERQVFRAHVISAASAARYLQMGANRLARGAGKLDARAERDRLIELLTAELADVREFALLWQQDRRLFMNPNIRWYSMLQSCVPWLVVDRSNPFALKIAQTEAQLERLRNNPSLDAVPQWGIR